MGASTKKIDTTPDATMRLRNPLIDWLGGTQTPSQVAGRSRPQGGIMGAVVDRHRALTGGDRSQTGGPQPNAGSPFDRIFAQAPEMGPRPIYENVDAIGPMNRGNYARDVNAGSVQYDGSGVGMIDPSLLPQVPGMGGMNPFQRGQIRDINGAVVNAPGTQSVDQLGGANSAFFQNMMAQLSPAFAQRRAEGLAAAKEASGTLTGSGYANQLGSAINRSLGDEQARLADYALQGMGMEVNRQRGDADRMFAANNATASNAMQAAIANQGMDSQFLNHLLQQGQLGQQGAIANQDAALRAMMANQGTQFGMSQADLQAQGMNQDAGLRAGIANQGADMAFGNADLQRMIQNQNISADRAGRIYGGDLQQLLAQYNMGGQIADNNAARFAALLGNQASAGVGPATIQRSGGIGSILGPLGGIAGTVLGGPIGGALAGKIGSMIGGGGGGTIAPAYQPGGSGWGGFGSNWRQNWP